MTVQTTIETQIISHSRKSFAEVIAKIESLVSKSDRSIFERTLAAQTVQERIEAVESLKRRSGFMVLNFTPRRLFVHVMAAKCSSVRITQSIDLLSYDGDCRLQVCTCL